MKFLKLDLNQLPKITRCGFTHQTMSSRHVTRYTSEYIIYAIEKGQLSLLHNGEQVNLSEGDVYVFNKGEYQKPLKNTECDFYFLHFDLDDAEWLNLDGGEFCDIVRTSKADYLKSDIYSVDGYRHIKAVINQQLHISNRDAFEYVLNLFKANALKHDNNDPLRRLQLSGGVAELLIKLQELSFLFLSGENIKKSRTFDLVERIANYIAKNYTTNFSSADIEKAFYINFDYANRIFKKQFGYSIIQYRNRLRINTAKTLVDSMPLDEVAYMLGFNDRYYFSRQFKKNEGVSPDEYRKRLR